MTTKLVNQRTGEYRVFSRGGAFVGTFFFGPLYFVVQGVWTWALISLASAIMGMSIFAVLGAPAIFILFLLVIAWIVWACFAPMLIESFYQQRGFIDEAPPRHAPSPRHDDGADDWPRRRNKLDSLTQSGSGFNRLSNSGYRVARSLE